MKTYKVGIAGFGWAAGAHLSTLMELPNYEPCAIMSGRKLDPDKIKDEYGCDVKIYNNYDEFVSDEEIDIVDICSLPDFHPEQIIKAADNRKNLIIEKPIALNFEDAVKGLEAVERNKVLTSVCFETRFVSAAKAMKSIIEQGLIGDIYYAECDYFHGIGPWYHQFEWNVKKNIGGSSLISAGCHALDILVWLADEEVEEVFSYSTKNPNKIYEPYEYDSSLITMLKFKNGKILGKVASIIDCMQPFFFNINIVGSHGTLQNDKFYSKKIEGLNGWSKMDVQLIDSGDVGNHPYKEQFTHFAECLDEGKEAINNFKSAFETHRIIYAVDKSAATGKPVSLSDF